MCMQARRESPFYEKKNSNYHDGFLQMDWEREQ
jgi:hypothetical protein